MFHGNIQLSMHINSSSPYNITDVNRHSQHKKGEKGHSQMTPKAIAHKETYEAVFLLRSVTN